MIQHPSHLGSCLLYGLMASLTTMTLNAKPLPPDATQPLATQPVSAQGTPAILVNQVGYTPHHAKVALLRNVALAPASIDIVDIHSNQVVGKASVLPARQDVQTHSADTIAEIHFDQLNQIGQYRFRLPALNSPVFEIKAQPDQDVTTLMLRSYYLQRCGVALNDPISGLQHGLDHAHDGVLKHDDTINPAGQTLAATGGWHDAGDYGKYVAPTTVTLAHLIDAYAMQPNAYPDGQLNIPESGNQRSDLLDEINVGLRWLLAMQRRDGAVYRKLSGKTWPKSLTPDQDQQTRYIYGISSPETAKFAAVMAQAARVYRNIDPVWSATLQAAAERSWVWLQTIKQPQYIEWVDGDDSGSGKYLYSNTDREPSLLTDRDDRVWAAAELWLLTGQKNYLDMLNHEIDMMSQLSLFEWKNTMLMGAIHLLKDGGAGLPTILRTRLHTAVLAAAQRAYQNSLRSAYRLANHRLIWGSNKMTASEGYLLAEAYRMTRFSPYLQAAEAQRDFILGLNPQGISFVTGIGTQRVRHVAHLYARAAQQDIVGLMVGGANVLAQDRIAPKDQGLYSYTDNDGAYSVNEYAIDYNGAMISLLAILATISDAESANTSHGR
jgi:endoglucanase